MNTKPGNWYFVVVCPNCKTRHFIGEAPSPMSPQGSLVYAWEVSDDCSHCGTHTDYPPEQVARWQIPLPP
jgi:hypothetical protein